MPYKDKAKKAEWARNKYRTNEAHRKAEISAVIARRDARTAREVMETMAVKGLRRKSYQPPPYTGSLCGRPGPDHRVGGA